LTGHSERQRHQSGPALLGYHVRSPAEPRAARTRGEKPVDRSELSRGSVDNLESTPSARGFPFEGRRPARLPEPVAQQPAPPSFAARATK